MLDDKVLEEFDTMPNNDFLINVYYSDLTKWQDENILTVMQELLDDLRSGKRVGAPKDRADSALRPW